MEPDSSKNVLIQNALVWGHAEADILVSGNRIAAIGTGLDCSVNMEVVDARGCLVYPGLINTHHHLAQSLLKGIPAGINQDLNAWLGSVPYKCWPHFTAEAMYAAARIGFAELLRSGCTTCADHHYLYHLNSTADMEEAIFQAAEEVGMRLVLCRGGNTTQGSHRGQQSVNNLLEPENIDVCIRRLEQTISRHHDPSEESMSRVVVAPTSMIHASTREDLVQLAEFARAKELRLHTHLLEVIADEQVSQQNNGMSAIDYAAEVGWLGNDVWFAHMVCADTHAIELLGQTATGIAHCPTSNARLGSGIAPICELESAGATISIGVDGSASAESGSLINETMLAWLVHRTQGGPEATEVANTLKWATRGGADVLGFSELGALEQGMLADLVIFDLNQPRFAGVWQPEWAPVICGEPMIARDVMVNGHWRLRSGEILGLDMELLALDSRRELDQLRASY